MEADADVSKKKPRPYGSGSVYQRSSDGLYVAVIEAGWTAKGTRRRIPVTGKTEAIVLRKLKKRRQEIDRDGITNVSTRETVKSWSEKWLKMAERELRPKPMANARSNVNNWIIPTIGHRRLSELTPGDIRHVADTMRAAGRAGSTRRGCHWDLVSMLKAAMAEGANVPPRVLLVAAPVLDESDREAMPIPEALATLAVASVLPHGTRWAAALLHGIRQGEALGLTWPCIDFDNDQIVVMWQLQPLPWVDRKRPELGFRKPDGLKVRHLTGRYHLVEVKTKSGFRVHPLIPAMREAFLIWREIAPANEWGLVWPTTTGLPVDAETDREEWHALQGAASLLDLEPYTDLGPIAVGHPAGRYYHLHEARHLTATQLLELGVDDHVITSLMGHSSIVTSRGYMHVNQAPRLAALELVAKRLQIGEGSDAQGE